MKLLQLLLATLALLLVGCGGDDTQEIFYLSALLFLALIPLVWLTRRVRGAAAPDAGGAH